MLCADFWILFSITSRLRNILAFLYTLTLKLCVACLPSQGMVLRQASSEMVRVRFCRTLSPFDVLTIHIACDYFIGKAD